MPISANQSDFGKQSMKIKSTFPLILISLMCMRFTVCFAAIESEAIDIAVSHISNATHILSTVLTNITKPYIYMILEMNGISRCTIMSR